MAGTSDLSARGIAQKNAICDCTHGSYTTILFVVSEARSRAFDHAYVPTSTVSPVLELTLL